MKHYVIRETSGYPFITRNNQLVQIGIGYPFTEEELPTLQCTSPTTYMSLDDNTIYTLGEITTASITAPVVSKVIPTETSIEETPVTGVVPSDMETGSETSET